MALRAVADRKAEPGLGTVEDLLRDFYGTRGYGHKVGLGNKPALLIIDFSVAFTTGTPNFPGGGFDAEVAKAAELLRAARAGFPIFQTTIAYDPDMQDAGYWAKKIPWIDGLQSGTREVEIDDRLKPRAGEPVLVKKYPSAFFGTPLDAELRRHGVDTLVIAGCTTSSCVRATTVDSMQHGYRTILAADAIGDFNVALHRLHLTDLGCRYADLMTAAELVEYFGRLAAGRAA